MAIGRAVINHLKIEDLEVWRLRVEELDAASSRSLLPGAPSASMTPPIGETRHVGLTGAGSPFVLQAS